MRKSFAPTALRLFLSCVLCGFWSFIMSWVIYTLLTGTVKSPVVHTIATSFLGLLVTALFLGFGLWLLSDQARADFENNW